MAAFYIDFHCHPALKPYGNSFGKSLKNSPDRRDRNSLWHYDSPNLFERAIQTVAGISKFTQADFTSLAYGNVRIVCASLYPIEKGFFNNNFGVNTLSDMVYNFVTGVGMDRVDDIQKKTNYYEDLCQEYDFYLQLNGREILTDSGDYKYILVSSYNEIKNYQSGPHAEKIIFVLFSIEGLHVLNRNIETEPDQESFINNLRAIKNWQHPPFFVSPAHHFYNHVCGHARSLAGVVGREADQSPGMNTGYTELGLEVLKECLSQENGKRIYIDIKHMSAISRIQYFNILREDYPNDDIPIIVSHGAANGLRSNVEPVVDFPDTGLSLMKDDINFYDEEIIMVARSGGIFGIQLDERRVCSQQTLKTVKKSMSINETRHYRAALIWNQIQHIAELLDRNNLFAWDCLVMGTDFEGIINPIDGFITSETFVNLEEHLERHASEYMKGRGKQLKPENQISSFEIVDRVFNANGVRFLQKYFL